MDQATKLKEEGNAHIQKQNYEQAIESYSKAIEAEPTNHILYSNRSLAYNKRCLWKEGLCDAQKSVELNPNWVKGWIRTGDAYWGLQRRKEACDAFAVALQLEPENKDVIQAYNAHQKEYIEWFFAPLTKTMEIEVKYINRHKGRGVFAKRDFFEKEIVYLERPLSSHRNIDLSRDNINCCNYTMKSFIPHTEFERPFDQVMDEFYAKQNLSEKSWVYCEHCKEDTLCGEKYFGEFARKKAWEEHHQILCTKNNPNHPMINLTKQCRALERTNPLFIVRMMATFVQRMRDISAKNPEKDVYQVRAEATEPFAMFMSNQEPGPLEEEAVQALRDILGTDEYNDVVSLQMYRELNGAILRNAQALNPVSDLHVHLNSIAPHKQQELVERYPDETIKSPLEFVTSDYMAQKCVMGTGLFLIANSTNHSCMPNVASTSSTNNYYVTMVAQKNIKKGEEIFISYINEQMSYGDRQEKLKQMYFFDCTCDKCKYRW